MCLMWNINMKPFLDWMMTTPQLAADKIALKTNFVFQYLLIQPTEK